MISKSPKKAIPKSCLDAWWYDNPKSIHVCIETEDGKGGKKVVTCRIARSCLIDYIERSK